MAALMSIFDLTRRSRQSLSLAAALLLLLFIWCSVFLSPGGQAIASSALPIAQSFLDHSELESNTPLPDHPALDLTHLAHHVRTPTFSYAQRIIRIKHYKGDRPDLTTVKQPLLPPPTRLKKGNYTEVRLPVAFAPLKLSIPNSPTVDTSILSFGIATRLPRLEIALPQLQHWLPNTGAQLHVLAPLPQEGQRDAAPELEESFQGLGINITITRTDAPFPNAYFTLIKHLYDRRTPATKWIVLLDDDTFIPSLPHLVDHLNKNYDSAKQQIIGATSDNIEQIRLFGLIPFGGGGIFISVPLAAHLTQDSIWDKCLSSKLDQGDQMVNECLNENSQVRPFWDGGLNQMDITGDPSGYFESGRRMLTVHHWRSWFEVNVAAAGNVSFATGQEGVFQRWMFDSDVSAEGGGKVVLSNGYSIVEYPEGLREDDLAKVELTWDHGMEEKWKFVHKIGPFRDKIEPALKKTMRLSEATVIDGVGVRQTYIERAEGNMVGRVSKRGEERMDKVVDLIWLF